MNKCLTMALAAVAALIFAGCTQLDEDVVKTTIIESLNEQILCNTEAKALEVDMLRLKQDGDTWTGSAMVSFKSVQGKTVLVPMNVTVKLMDGASGDVWVESEFFNPIAAAQQLGVE